MQVTIDEIPVQRTWTSAGPANERTAELEWLANESAPYAGQWVVLHGRQLIAHGITLAAVSEAAGLADPFVANVPDNE